MAITDKKKRQRPDLPGSPSQENRPGASRPRRPKRRWYTLVAIVGVLLLVLVGLAPMLAVRTPLVGYALCRAAMLEGAVTFQSASLGWFSATSISGIEIRDPQGETVLTAERLVCNRSLLNLLFNAANLGTVTIEKPRLNAKLSAEGSNVETVLARWLSAPSSSTAGVDLSLAITDGEATVADLETGQSWHVANLQFSMEMARRACWPAHMEGTAALDDPARPGALALTSNLKASESSPADPSAWCGLAGTDGDFNIQATALPLALFQRLAARFVPGLKLDGTVDSRLESQWAGPANVKFSGNVNGSGLRIESKALASDVIRLEKVQAACRAARQDRQLTIEEAKVDCELGNLTAGGRAELGEQGLTSVADLLRGPDCSVQGTLDLARLARLLPGTLRVRPGTEITSGQVQLSIRSVNPATAVAGSLAWQARLETSNLTAVDRGREIRWNKPVAIGATLHQDPQGTTIDSLTCESDFLRVTGRGTPDQLTATVRMDLRRLSEELGRFVDLGGLVLSGEGDGQVQWARNPGGEFETGGQFTLRNFQLAAAKREPWIEENLTVVLQAKGRADAAAPMRLDALALQLRSPGDQVDIRLLQPMAELNFRSPWPLDVQVQGRLDRWPGWLAAMIPRPEVRLAGDYRASAQVTMAADAVTFSEAKLTATKLAVAGANWNASDPAFELTAEGRYNVASSKLQLERCELSSGPARVRTAGQVAFGNPGEVQLGGDLAYQWDKLNPLLQPYCGTAVQFFGGGTSPISYRGPLAWQQGEGAAAMQFTGGNVYGLQVGPGELKLRLVNGVLRAEPLQVACNRGTVALQPELRLAAQPMELRMSGGTLARQIQLDPAACHSALKYIAPILASVTQSRGEFSIELEGCRVPLGDMNRAEIAGRMIVHSAEVNPGPLVQQLTSLLSAPPTLVRIQPQSVILFRMTRGRIYHQGLVLEFPDVTMKTYGSVGLDESVKLMVETSVPTKWLPANAVTDVLKKQKLQVPVGGTLKSPQLDLAELARVKAQVLGNIGRNLLESELGNQLNRLIQPKP